eukprot:6492744-Amphidinium_carterae.5
MPLDVVTCVTQACQRRYKQRSWEHCARARLGKQRRQLLRHRHGIVKTCDKYVQDHAVRCADIAGLAQRRQRLGKGGYKKWLPEAVQRLCFGTPRFQHKAGKRNVQRAPTLQLSARALATWQRASHGHIQVLRNATAMHIDQRVQDQIQAALQSSVVCQVSCDATTVDCLENTIVPIPLILF